MSEEEEEQRLERIARGVHAVREGHGANCSSIGSVIDTLFAGAVLGGALYAAVVAALAREKVRVVGNDAGHAAPNATTPEAPDRRPR